MPGVGDRVSAGEFEGVVVGVHPATLELERPDGSRVHAPYSKLLGDGIVVQRP